MKGLIASFGIFGFSFTLVINLAIAYVVGSAVVSVVKVCTNQCDVQLGVEPTLNGNWLCPKK